MYFNIKFLKRQVLRTDQHKYSRCRFSYSDWHFKVECKAYKFNRWMTQNFAWVHFHDLSNEFCVFRECRTLCGSVYLQYFVAVSSI